MTTNDTLKRFSASLIIIIHQQIVKVNIFNHKFSLCLKMTHHYFHTGGFYMDKSNNIIGSRILELRTRAGEKQEELAQVIHCNRGSLSNYEKGARTPDAYTIALIAKHYNATSDYLLGLTDTPSTNRDIAFISDYTGLDESTIQEFHSQKSFIPTHTNNNYESTMYQNLLLHRV